MSSTQDLPVEPPSDPPSLPSGPYVDDASRRKRIVQLALPIIGAMVSQNVLNLTDTAITGTLGTQALAAVGLGGFINWKAFGVGGLLS